MVTMSQVHKCLCINNNKKKKGRKTVRAGEEHDYISKYAVTFWVFFQIDKIILSMVTLCF